MNTIVISGIELSITFDDQVLNMGGPSVGTLTVEGIAVSNNCIVDNFVFSEDNRLLFFVKFHVITDHYYYFTINFYNIDQNIIFEFNREFDMVYIKQIINENELEIFHAFHDQFLSHRQIFDLDKEEFKEILQAN